MPAKRLTAAASWIKRKAIRTLLFCWQCVSYMFSLAFYLCGGLCLAAALIIASVHPARKPARRGFPVVAVDDGGVVAFALPRARTRFRRLKADPVGLGQRRCAVHRGQEGGQILVARSMLLSHRRNPGLRRR